MLISKWEGKKNEKCSDEAKMRPVMVNFGKNYTSNCNMQVSAKLGLYKEIGFRTARQAGGCPRWP